MKPTHPLQVAKAAHRYISIPYRRTKAREKPTAFVFGFSPWKTFINEWLPEYKVVRRDREVSAFEFYTSLAPMMLSDPRSEVFIWGYKGDPMILAFCKKHHIPITKVEDGFIRSVQLGATKAPPLSLVMDRKALYFDATEPSSLEDILNTYDFKSDPGLVDRATAGIEALLRSRLSKYNVGASVKAEELYGVKDRKRVLVVGQVEGDMSIKLGCNRSLNNNDLVWIAARENPGAQIIYKPHPEVLAKTREAVSNPRDVEGIAMVLTQDISLADALDTVDHVYTITSLSGFEALIRGIEVTCAGAPFYSGWGLTNDLQPVPRRKRKLAKEELFAAAYILYARYFDPNAKQFIQFEDALTLLSLMRVASARKREMILARKEERQAEMSLAAPPLAAATQAATKTVTMNEVRLETIRTIRRLIDLADPVKLAPAPAKAPVKVAAKPPPKKSTTISQRKAR